MSVLSSCAKKESGVKAAVKSQGSGLNPAVSAQADQQGAALGADYKIATISIPVASETDSGYIVNAELLTPTGQTLPLTTRHENGQNDSEGVYTDSQKALQVYVQARCFADNCFNYTLIVTVYKNNQQIYQAAAISYKDDCKFNAISASYSVGSFLQGLNDLDNKHNPTPKNDSTTCSY